MTVGRTQQVFQVLVMLIVSNMFAHLSKIDHSLKSNIHG